MNPLIELTIPEGIKKKKSTYVHKCPSLNHEKNDTVLGYSGSLIYNFLLKCENTLASHTGILLSLSYTYFYLI